MITDNAPQVEATKPGFLADLLSRLDALASIYSLIGSIMRYLEEMDQGPHSNILLFNLLLLNNSHEQEAASHVLNAEADMSSEVDGSVLSVGKRYISFANAAYGYFMNTTFFESDYGEPIETRFKQDLDRWSITKETGISWDDIIATRLEAVPFRKFLRPGYFIAIDHTTQSVVLAIRGTSNIEDVILDLLCESVPFFGGEAHEGFVRSSDLLLEETIDTLRSQLQKYSGYRLVIVGHSMGGSVSTLLTIKLAHEREKSGINVPISCFTYGSAPTVSPPSMVPEELSNNIHTFVHNNDVVPRSSLQSVVKLLESIQKVDDEPNEMGQHPLNIMTLLNPLCEATKLTSARTSEKPSFHKALKEMSNSADNGLIKYTKTAIKNINMDRDKFNSSLAIPGQIYWLNKEQLSAFYFARKVNSKHFEKVLLVKDAVVDHVPNFYKASFELLRPDQGI